LKRDVLPAFGLPTTATTAAPWCEGVADRRSLAVRIGKSGWVSVLLTKLSMQIVEMAERHRDIAPALM
jgi:hypothetical protein